MVWLAGRTGRGGVQFEVGGERWEKTAPAEEEEQFSDTNYTTVNMSDRVQTSENLVFNFPWP